MDGEYPQGLAAAVTALLNGHNELRKCHRELEEREQAEVTWQERHDQVVAQRNQLKQDVIDMRERGLMKPADAKAAAIGSATTEELLAEIARRAS